MLMNVNYEKIYLQYNEAIEIQKNVIKRKRELLNKAKKESNYAEVKRLNSLLLLLYEEKSELEERADGLRDYIS